MFFKGFIATGDRFTAEGAELPVLVISRGAGVEQSFEFLNVDVVCLARLVLHE